MSKSSRLKALLEQGYFPEELPPPFNTFDFARFRTAIGTAWTARQQDNPKTIPEIFSIPKQRGWRRDLSIVNPIAQYHVASLIADNWVEVRKCISKNSLSAETIEINLLGGRSVPRPEFELVWVKRSEVSAKYDYVLIADISRFYGTLYTHAIPWGMHEKTWCKINLNTPVYDNSLGAKLDRAIRKGNDNQTIGIPVGPDTSRIASEIVAVAIDTELRKKIGVKEEKAVRHVDDWFIGFDSLGEAEAAVAVLSAACRDFQLEIHPEKTRCAHVPREVEPIWPNVLQELRITGVGAAQRRSIDRYFGEAFHFASLHPKDNVLSYAVSRSRGITISLECWRTYETYLLKAARSNPTTLPVIVQILANYNFRKYPIDKVRISKLIQDLIRNAAPSAFHAEAAWVLFLAKALSISLPSKWLEPVCELESSVCALLTLDLRSRGLIAGTLSTALWQRSMNERGLVSNMWLLAYEADLKGWLTGAVPYAKTHTYFSELRKRNVSFYDVRRNVKDIRKSKPRKPSDALAKLLRELAIRKAETSSVADAPGDEGNNRRIGFGGYGGDYW